MWLHSTETQDFSLCLFSLMAALWPDRLALPKDLNLVARQYRQQNPVPRHVVISFTRGFPDGSPRKFIRELERRLSTWNTEDLVQVSGLLSGLCSEAQWNRSDDDNAFIRVMCRSTDLFHGLFLALRVPENVAPSASYLSHAFSRPIVMLAETILRRTITEWTGQREPFIRLCLKARLFDGLESVFTHGQNIYLAASTLHLYVSKGGALLNSSLNRSYWLCPPRTDHAPLGFARAHTYSAS